MFLRGAPPPAPPFARGTQDEWAEELGETDVDLDPRAVMCEMVLGDPLHRSSVMERKREVWLPNLWQQIPSQIRVPSEQLPSSLPPRPPRVSGQQ